jgi:hypothetical protein
MRFGRNWCFLTSDQVTRHDPALRTGAVASAHPLAGPAWREQPAGGPQQASAYAGATAEATKRFRETVPPELLRNEEVAPLHRIQRGRPLMPRGRANKLVLNLWLLSLLKAEHLPNVERDARQVPASLSVPREIAPRTGCQADARERAWPRRAP